MGKKITVYYQSMNSTSSTSCHRLAHSMGVTDTIRTAAHHKGKANVAVEPHPVLGESGELLYALGPPHVVEAGGSERALEDKKIKDAGLRGGRKRKAPTPVEELELKTREDQKRNLYRRHMENVFATANRYNKNIDFACLGEVDANAGWSFLKTPLGNKGYVVNSTAAGPMKACQCFSLFSVKGAVEEVASGVGWTCAQLNRGAKVLFVHVPNSICRDAAAVKNFYTSAMNKVAQNSLCGGLPIHAVIGDTNQQSRDFTLEILNADRSDWKEANSSKTVRPITASNVELGGTNSTSNKRYDVGLYNTQNCLSASLEYTGKFMQNDLAGHQDAQAVTDHNGMILTLELK